MLISTYKENIWSIWSMLKSEKGAFTRLQNLTIQFFFTTRQSVCSDNARVASWKQIFQKRKRKG